MKSTHLEIPKKPGLYIIQHIGRWILGLALTYAGISHLTFNRTEFLAQVPNWVPLDGDFVVLASGVVEIVLGLSLLFWSSKRVQIGMATALFFVLIFPGNIAQYLNGTDAFGLDSDKARLIRLFFQPLLILWALWATGAWAYWKNRK
jgi:uncharacterized membrane protein